MIERREPAEAVGLYTAPFLDGLFLSDAPEFERSVTHGRERLAGAYGRRLSCSPKGPRLRGIFHVPWSGGSGGPE